ncbi:MAG TPA: rod shape-determining protein RodA [Gemmatimonadales bacterium]|nr:rod shape-determining protein RodA [Gemmatimonadales bacterium]
MLRRIVGDLPLVLTALALTAYGVAMVYSAGQTDVRSTATGLWQMQLFWVAVALAGALVASRLSVRVMDWLTTPAYVAMLALLALTLILGGGAGTAASTKSWIGIGPARIQPAEFAKIVVVLMLAKVLASRREPARSLLDLWLPAIVVFMPWVLIMAQPDLGTGIVFVGIFFAMLFWSGVPWQLLVLLASPAVSLILSFSTWVWGAWFLLLLAFVFYHRPYLLEGVSIVTANVAMGVIAPMLWDRLAPYQQNRLLVFLDPSRDPRNSGYHVIQSKIAIGSGGWFGSGYTSGSQKRLAFLPEQHTDFIFAVVGEELGFIGVMVALGLFALLFLRTVRVAERANDPFGSLVAFGLLSSWFVHVVVNIGMTLNLMPITGIPLPFFSYGGSFMLASWIAVGILLRVSMEGRGRAGRLAI